MNTARKTAPRWLAIALALCPPSFACGSSQRTGPRPEASLATSPEAQREFRALRETWIATAPGSRGSLAPELLAFVNQHPNEAPSQRARLYLAWLSLREDRPDEARRWLSRADGPSAGSTSDLRELVEASVELREGLAQQVYPRLLELEGRLVDEDDRLLCLDRLIEAALASRRYAEAVRHVAELASLSARRHRERVWRTLESDLERVPVDILERSLSTLSSSSIGPGSAGRAERVAATNWLRRQIRSILARSAIDQRDVGLARRLVSAPVAGQDSRYPSSQLMQLATRGEVVPTVAGRTLGLALQLEDAKNRQRSLEVATGASLTLENLRAPGQGVELSTLHVDPDGSLGDTLARLAGAGASLLAAGVDVEGARQAAEFAAREGVPVLLLHDPALDAGSLPERAFVLGSSPEAANVALVELLNRRYGRVALVGSPQYPCPEVQTGSSAKTSSALESSRAIAFLADASCARNVLMDLSEARRHPAIGIGLDALTVLGDDLSRFEVWSAAVGWLPSFDASDASGTLERFRALKGRNPSWYEALGHDLAVLAEHAIVHPAADSRDEPASTTHQRIGEALTRVEARNLWTSAETRLGSDRQLERSFDVESVVSSPRP